MTKETLLAAGAALITGIPVGILLTIGLTANAAPPSATPLEPTTINVVCESFEGPQGPAGADGQDGRDGVHSTFTFKHDPELEGLFSEQNVKIETQPIN
jgi:hypothetical protein